MANHWNLPDLGFGVGLRTVHFPYILAENPLVDWFEILSENFLDTGGRPAYVLDQIAERYPIVMHGVSLNIGSTSPLDFEYLKKLKALAARTKAHWISDHLCWTGVSGLNTHDLLPMPYTDESLAHVAARVRTVSEFLERPLFLENPSTYLAFEESTWREWDFLATLARLADCGLLLDVNNVYVSAFNHDFDPYQYLDAIPVGRVAQIHLAGHTNFGTHILDTHSAPVLDPVWDLYAYATRRLGPVSTLLEWDEHIPSFNEVHAEARKARQFRSEAAHAA
jgi:uncharacterized protein (UPF0276 family)